MILAGKVRVNGEVESKAGKFFDFLKRARPPEEGPDAQLLGEIAEAKMKDLSANDVEAAMTMAITKARGSAPRLRAASMAMGTANTVAAALDMTSVSNPVIK